LPDAGAFSERQRAGSYRPKLLDSSEKPAAELFTSLNPFHCMRVSIPICRRTARIFFLAGPGGLREVTSRLRKNSMF
jgi:hypothetical protein